MISRLIFLRKFRGKFRVSPGRYWGWIQGFGFGLTVVSGLAFHFYDHVDTLENRRPSGAVSGSLVSGSLVSGPIKPRSESSASTLMLGSTVLSWPLPGPAMEPSSVSPVVKSKYQFFRLERPRRDLASAGSDGWKLTAIKNRDTQVPLELVASESGEWISTFFEEFDREVHLEFYFERSSGKRVERTQTSMTILWDGSEKINPKK